MTSKAAATREGKKLLAKMQGKGWKLEVWENLGWHFGVRNGALSVIVSGDRYSTLMSDEADGVGGAPIWFVRRWFRDPNAAVRAQLRVCREFLKRCDTLVSAVEANIQIGRNKRVATH